MSYDICFKHILPRLRGTDLKLLYEVNTETRKLIKRSSRKGDLKKGFRVREMSSISTLEVAWEHKSLWPSWWDETDFCFGVAYTNKLEFLKWAREEKECEWDEWTIKAAAFKGNLEMIKYCVANKCPIDEDGVCICCQKRSSRGTQILTRRRQSALGFGTASWAALNGHLHILEYLVERKYDKYDEWACAYAAENGHLDCLKYLHETAKAPWDSLAVLWAHKRNRTECLQYLASTTCGVVTR